MQTRHFEFRDWEKAFNYYFDCCDRHSIRFVISTHEYTSGYWVEMADKEPTDTDIIYSTKDEVTELRKRVIHEIQHAQYNGRSPRFTT